MRFALIPMALALAAPTENTRPIYAGMPPPRYWGEAVAVVFYVNDIVKHCGADVPEGITIRACTRITTKGTPVIFLPNPCLYGLAGEAYATLACHEKAHVRGWEGDHPL